MHSDDDPLSPAARSTDAGILLARILVLVLCCRVSHGAEPVAAAPQRAVYTAFGGRLPALRTEDALFCSHLYVAAVDPETKLPRWVAYRVHAAGQYGDNEFVRNWESPLTEVLLEPQDYLASGYDMGHLAPLAAFRASPHASELNWTCNIIPQAPTLNRGLWQRLEAGVCEMSFEHTYVDVLCGPLYEGEPAFPLPHADEPHAVPTHVWKQVQAGAGLRQWIFPQSVSPGLKLDEFEVDPAEFNRRVQL